MQLNFFSDEISLTGVVRLEGGQLAATVPLAAKDSLDRGRTPKNERRYNF